MSMREFLRGGYQKIDSPTVVSRNGLPVFTVLPTNSQTWTSNAISHTSHSMSRFPDPSVTYTSTLSTNKNEE